MSLVHPVPSGRPTDPYGPRGVVPGIGDLGFHTGQDWAAAAGTPIYAAHTGRVSRKWWDAFPNGGGAGGNMVEVVGDDGLVTRYAHMLSPSNFQVGARVAAGRSILGYVGATGAATGEHLHFEVLSGGKYVNPLPYINNTQGEDDLTPQESQMLSAIWQGMFGPANAGGTQMTWKSIDGPRKGSYGLLDIDTHTQLLVAQLSGQVAAQTALIEQLLGGATAGNIDMERIEAAAKQGAKEGISTLTLKAE